MFFFYSIFIFANVVNEFQFDIRDKKDNEKKSTEEATLSDITTLSEERRNPIASSSTVLF